MRLTLPFSGRRLRRSPNGTNGAAPNDQARSTGGDGPLFDEALLGQLRRLTLLSRRTIAEGLAGEHRSKRRGASPEFADFKSYSQGDDYRRIDWNTYARLDGLFVRLSEVTTELSVHVLLDASNSMDWRGSPDVPTKFTYARRLAGALSYVSLWHFDRVVIAPFGETLAQQFGPSQGRAHIVPMLRFLERLTPLGQTDLPTTLEAYVRARRRPGILLLISDLLSGEPEQLKDLLRMLRARGWQTIIIHVLDETELAPAAMLSGGPGGRSMLNLPLSELLDVESAQRLRLTPTDSIFKRYQTAFDGWLAEIEHACDDEHVDYLQMQTGWPFETIVLRLLHAHGVVA